MAYFIHDIPTGIFASRKGNLIAAVITGAFIWGLEWFYPVFGYSWIAPVIAALLVVAASYRVTVIGDAGAGELWLIKRLTGIRVYKKRIKRADIQKLVLVRRVHRSTSSKTFVTTTQIWFECRAILTNSKIRLLYRSDDASACLTATEQIAGLFGMPFERIGSHQLKQLKRGKSQSHSKLPD